jgi:hypothetical protein
MDAFRKTGGGSANLKISSNIPGGGCLLNGNGFLTRDLERSECSPCETVLIMPRLGNLIEVLTVEVNSDILH